MQRFAIRGMSALRQSRHWSVVFHSLRERVRSLYWFIALSLQMKIMIATGQIAVVYPMLDKIYQRLYAGKSRWLLENYGAGGT